jgi:ketosteroid isomerase-like protein
MKKLIITAASVLILFYTHAQSNDEAEIRKLEYDAKEAFLKKDTVTLLKLYSPSLVINSPGNKVETFQEILAKMKRGGTDRESFERIIERITFADNVAIVMGNETIKPSGQAPDAGKIVKRRYTDIWMKKSGSWKLIGRQSTIYSVE